ncbi:MAG: tagaturonate reductase [Clostridia bacterium]|nr:tagaturonate reductase [Clostridia bacterium]
MTKVLQFGEGNFLRTFVDHYFDTLNEEGGEFSVHIVKPISFGSLENFRKQNNRYHIVLRGMDGAEAVEKVREIKVVAEAIDPFADMAAYEKLAVDPELKIIVSNTTEAGICFHAEDKMDGFAEITYPAKLTKLLYKRFEAGLGGLYLLPVELIDNNADALCDCVNRYIDLWKLPAAFKAFNEKENIYCNTLVDRIVSGHPKTPEDRAHLNALTGDEDLLVSVGEPFGLWAIEDKGNIRDYIKEGFHGIDVVLTKNITHYKKQKVRVLNGSHTNLVAAGIVEGAVTVYDCMKSEKLRAFVEGTLDSEIIPFVSDDTAGVRAFADSVLSRFENPYLNHLLVSISLNSISKWRARCLPSFEDYFAKHGVIAPNMTKGFSYLMYLYKSVRAEGERFIANLKSGAVEVKDDLPYLTFFANGGSVKDFMANAEIFGRDLTAIPGFLAAVTENLTLLEEGKSLL